MSGLKNISLKISNYKSFGEEEQGFERIMPVNLIIGRNNSGKSALLDLIEYACQPTQVDVRRSGHKGNMPNVSVADFLMRDELEKVFSPNAGGGVVPGPGNHWEFGKKWVGKRATFDFSAEGLQFKSVEPTFGHGFQDFEARIAKIKPQPFSGFIFKRLLSERDILPEVDGVEATVLPNGRGLTNIVQQFLNKSDKQRELIEETLLTEFNSIFKPDGRVEAIVARQHGTSVWELFFKESEKGWIPLSATGSGIKTVLLVLVFLNVIPKHEKRELRDYFFGFEELENNLHPALQRRLLLYLRDKAVKSGCRLFLTTHSNVSIDLFAKDNQAQILHVTHNGKSAAVKQVVTYRDNKGILDDLDVRASDLLQANGIVWVEGPSDRLYFNRWIELWSDDLLKEGIHYQCVFYGGKLLAHLSADDPTDVEDLVKILRVNRNAILIIDSDQEEAGSGINKTKQRVLKEIGESGGLPWLTKGRTIENYLPSQALSFLYGLTVAPIGQYEKISDYLENLKSGEGKRFLQGKVLFAAMIRDHITKEGITETVDLRESIEHACNLIRRWNQIPITAV